MVAKKIPTKKALKKVPKKKSAVKKSKKVSNSVVPPARLVPSNGTSVVADISEPSHPSAA